MYLADYHTHSLCSPDGSVPLTEMAQAALDVGLNELCLTDHCDFINFRGNPDFSFRWEPIEEQLRQARPAFVNRLTLKMGLELGEAWENPELAESIYCHQAADFVLASVHNLPLAQGGTDFYEIQYNSESLCYAVLDQYFQSMRLLSQMDCYDVLAHIIYPLRYMNRRDGNHVTLDRYRDTLIAIFKAAIHKHKGIELNTCRGRTVEDWRWVMELYRDCGGTIVTLGSDAHTPKDVGAGIKQGIDLLRELGFTHIATYEKHTPKLLRI